MRKLLVACIALVLMSQPLSLAAQETLPPWRRDLPEGRQQATIIVGETTVQVDLAVDPFEQMLGLGYRNGLDDDTGMLFIGDTPRARTFWMKGMRFCLDIIWIENGVIVGAAESVCPDPPGTPDGEREMYSSGVPVSHVLEMPAGWLDAHGYGSGTPVDLGDLAP